MQIWLVKLNEDAENYEEYETYQGFVVIAETEVKARNLCKRTAVRGKANQDGWSKRAKQATCNPIGDAYDVDAPGVVLADFIAG